MIKLPVGDFELGIGVFQNHQLVIKLPIGDFENHQATCQNHQLVILSPIGDFHFQFSISTTIQKYGLFAQFGEIEKIQLTKI